MKEAKFKELVCLSKGFKIFLGVLSVVAVVAFCFAFAVKEQSQDKIYTAQMTLNSQRLTVATDLDKEFSYNARLHFPHLAFLLRSKTLSSVKITKFLWNEKVDLSLMNNLYNEGRGVFFTSTQNLQSANINDLGSVQYRVDFAPFFQTILCYYLIIASVAILLYFILTLSYMKKQLSADNIAGGGGLPIFQINLTPTISLFACLYLFFFTLNAIFPTQSDDLGATFRGLSGAYDSYIGWNGRIGELLRVSFGAYFAATPFYPFINAFFGATLLYLFFVLIFARLPLVNSQDNTISQKLSDISIICFILVCLLYFRGFGSVFYWAAGSFNYLWAWVLILIWCVPYRLFWNAFFTDKNSQSSNSHIFSMLILGVWAGWASELGIVIVLFQVAFIIFARYKGIKLPFWYYAGVFGFVVGWCILYFSPGHAARANLEVVRAYYTSISELLAMPFAESFKRFTGTFKDTMPHLFVATLGVCVFLWLKFSSQRRKNKAIIIICTLIFITLYSTPNLRFAFVLLSALLCFVAGFCCKKANQQAGYLFVLSGLFLAYFLMSAATIQIALPYRAQLPYVLLATTLIIIVWLLLKPYLTNFTKIISVSLCALCTFYALFVLTASVDMRLKWERMLALIDAQKAMGNECVVVRADTFRSYYKGYGDWGNPNANTNEWPNTTYANFFGVKKFIVMESVSNVKFD